MPTPRDKCSRFGLSFFISIKAARRKFKTLSDRLDADGRYGSFVGEIDLKPDDGHSGEPDDGGHFNLHLADGALLAGRVKFYYKAEEG